MDRKLLKANARQQLGGSIFASNWLMGLVVCLIFLAIPGTVAGMLGGIGGSIGGFSSIIQFSNVDLDLTSASPESLFEVYQKVFTLLGPMYGIYCGVGLLVFLFLSCPLTYGLNKTFLDLVMGGEKIEIDTLFSGFKRYGETVLLGFMQNLFVTLWSLLFIIPGIVKYYAYSLAFYVMIDHPEYGWRECLKESERLMKGYKLSYFVLQLSFIGWAIVGALACGVGEFFVSPYEYCAYANFYAWRVAKDQPGIAEELV